MLRVTITCCTHDSSLTPKVSAHGAGPFSKLMTDLQSGASVQQQNAANTICDLTSSSQSNRDGIIAAGALPLLIALLRSDQPALQQTAAKVSGSFRAALSITKMLS